MQYRTYTGIKIIKWPPASQPVSRRMTTCNVCSVDRVEFLLGHAYTRLSIFNTCTPKTTAPGRGTRRASKHTMTASGPARCEGGPTFVPWCTSYGPLSAGYNNNKNKRPFTPKSMPPTGDEHAELKT